MAELVRPDIIVYVCTNCTADVGRLRRQWNHQGAHVMVREVPCSGKMDGQYLIHALEGGVRGLCVVACPKGECRLTQGNYRAEVRVGTLRRLLDEIGLEPQRVELLHAAPERPFEQFEGMIHDAVGRLCALGESPIRAAAQPATH